jgi:NADPH2:quinone reductase
MTQAKSDFGMTTPGMKAIEVDGGKGPAAALKLVSRPRPAPGPGEILVRVRAAGINHADLHQRRGAYPPPPGASDILGMEVAGEVAELGPGAPRWRVGDRVAALIAGGGYAEYAVMDARHALPIPAQLDFAHAASLPETTFTVWSNVFEIGALKYGETLLLHGATSGIGVTAIQMAKTFGSRVIATSRGAHKTARAKALGADLSIDSTDEDWVEAVKAFGGADVALEMVGGDQVGKDLSVMKPHGRVVMIAFLAGARGEIDFNTLMRRGLTLTGSTLRNRDANEKARLAAAVEAKVWPLVASGSLKPVIAAVFPLAEAGQAHAWLERGDHIGKVILAV